MDTNHRSASNQALEAAIKKAGSQSALARMIGVTQRAVWRWLHEQKPLPAEHVLTVEAKTGITKELLRPDLYRADDPDTRSPGLDHKAFAK